MRPDRAGVSDGTCDGKGDGEVVGTLSALPRGGARRVPLEFEEIVDAVDLAGVGRGRNDTRAKRTIKSPSEKDKTYEYSYIPLPLPLPLPLSFPVYLFEPLLIASLSSALPSDHSITIPSTPAVLVASLPSTRTPRTSRDSPWPTELSPPPSSSRSSRRSPSPSGGWQLSTHPIKGAEAPKEVLEYLYSVFSKELQGGYEVMRRTSLPESSASTTSFTPRPDIPARRSHGLPRVHRLLLRLDHDSWGGAHRAADVGPANAGGGSGGRDPVEAIGGCYYIKPNYPGRSSHNCNAGFIVPPTHRGKKIGYNLGKSYLEYAPRLGYKGSVFNLVYKNNVASLKIWDSLGFQRVGLIPNAGRLRTQDGLGEEYVDAVVVHKSFVFTCTGIAAVPYSWHSMHGVRADFGHRRRASLCGMILYPIPKPE
ncbi:hypothetical protein EHS25_003152 [Saitozyma podzolica]|uniref:N-acetyltransferase domain-containing protein n=1 Tax=Saitozyma podzolica TaxID=1890683 RepID=A0A427Y846_9TREE|nr:hypothetical protein EHS25_003152 [Saitozyma podzolica]